MVRAALPPSLARGTAAHDTPAALMRAAMVDFGLGLRTCLSKQRTRAACQLLCEFVRNRKLRIKPQATCTVCSHHPLNHHTTKNFLFQRPSAPPCAGLLGGQVILEPFLRHLTTVSRDSVHLHLHVPESVKSNRRRYSSQPIGMREFVGDTHLNQSECVSFSISESLTGKQ